MAKKISTAKELIRQAVGIINRTTFCGKCGNELVSKAVWDGATIKLAEALAQLAVEQQCEWKYDDYHNMYETQCGKAWCFLGGTAKDNDCKYCPYCGGVIKQALKPSKGGEG